MSLLTVEHLSVQFGGVAAVDDVSFDLRAGEILGLIVLVTVLLFRPQGLLGEKGREL